MITRRGLLKGAAASATLAPAAASATGFSAKWLNYLPSIIKPADAAVLFEPGTVLLNQPGYGPFGASFPHQLPVATSPWAFTSWFMWSTNSPVQTSPIFGLNGLRGQIFKVQILPPGWYAIYPPGRRPNLGPVSTHFSGNVLQVFAGNPNGAQALFQNWFAQLPANIFNGAMHLVQSFLNPQGDPVGAPLSHRVFVDNVEMNVYPGVGQNPRALNTIFDIPWGEDSGYQAPSAWVAYDYPIFGGDRGQAWVNANSYQGVLDHLWWDPTVPIDPSMAANQFLSREGAINLLVPNGANVLYPGQVPPAVYLHGGATNPLGFRHNQGIISEFSDTLTLDTRFFEPEGFITIQDITIGGPAGVE